MAPVAVDWNTVCEVLKIANFDVLICYPFTGNRSRVSRSALRGLLERNRSTEFVRKIRKWLSVMSFFGCPH